MAMFKDSVHTVRKGVIVSYRKVKVEPGKINRT